MASRTIAKGKNSPHSVLSLPFVADLPDPKNSRRTVRSFWNIPDHADYGEANDIGRRWAVEYVAYERQHQPALLTIIARHIAERESELPPNSHLRGFSVGFFSAIADLATAAGYTHPDYEARWLENQESYYRKLREEAEVQRRAEIAVRVARMNAGKAAKARRAAHHV